jgi:hypothetical protein
VGKVIKSVWDSGMQPLGGKESACNKMYDKQQKLIP